MPTRCVPCRAKLRRHARRACDRRYAWPAPPALLSALQELDVHPSVFRQHPRNHAGTTTQSLYRSSRSTPRKSCWAATTQLDLQGYALLVEALEAKVRARLTNLEF